MEYQYKTFYKYSEFIDYMVKEEDLTSLLPDREFVLELLKKLEVPYSVRRHSLQVAEIAIDIANKIKGAKVDKKLVEIGALLHDIGRVSTHGFGHAFMGGKILRKRRFPEELARICERHILGGLDKEDAKSVGLPEKDFYPVTLEEKIVCLADKLTDKSGQISVNTSISKLINKRFQIWFNKYGKSQILLKGKERIEKIQKEVEDLMQ